MRVLVLVCAFGFLSFQSGYCQINADSLIALVSVHPDTVKVRMLNQYAAAYFNRDLILARTLSDRALDIASRVKYNKGEAQALNNISRVLTRQGDFAKSIEFSKRAEELYTLLNDRKGLADVMNTNGLTYNLEGKYPQALDNFTRELAIRNELGQKDLISSTIENIGTVHFRQGDYKTALQYFKDSYDAYKGLGNEASAAKILVNMGATYNKLKLHREALAAHNESLAFFEKTNNRIGIGIAHNNIGSVYFELGDYRKAIDHYSKSLEVKRSMNDKRGIAVSLRNIAEAYIKLNQLANARESAEQSLKISEDIHSREQLKDAYEMLSNIHSKAGEFEKALMYERKLAEQKDSMFSADKTAQISRMRAIYETDKAENEARLTKIQADSDIRERDLQRNFFVALTIFFLLASIMALYLFRQKQKSNNLLSDKNTIIERSLHERETLLREIHHRVKNNLQIISSLLSLQSKSLSDNEAQDAISESRNRVKSMSLIHEQLYQDDTISGVEMRDYIQRLVNSLVSSYGVDRERISITIESDDILLDVDSAIPLGLILNELISNSMKYAFPGGRSGTITVTLRDLTNQLKLNVHDDGIGFDPAQKNGQSFGLNMVNSLMRKLRAEMKVASNAGTSIELTINDYKKVNFV